MIWNNNKKRPTRKKKYFALLPKDTRYIDYKDVELLKNFINSHGKILSSSITGLKKHQQRLISLAIKRARIMALLPFVKERIRSSNNTSGK